jgi:hypothetical protein
MKDMFNSILPGYMVVWAAVYLALSIKGLCLCQTDFCIAVYILYYTYSLLSGPGTIDMCGLPSFFCF